MPVSLRKVDTLKVLCDLLVGLSFAKFRFRGLGVRKGSDSGVAGCARATPVCS